VQLNFRNERKKTNRKQHDRAILKYNLTYLEQTLVNCDGKLFKIFPTQRKQLQFKKKHNDTLEAMADETSWLKTVGRDY